MANPLFNVTMFNTGEAPLCGDETYRAADFLVGNWESTGLDGSRFRVEGTPILDGGNGFDWYHGQTEDGSIVFTDESGAESVRLVPGDGDTLTRVLGGTPINFVRR